MKHPWHTLALGAALAVSGCADSATSPAPVPERIPANIVVPKIRESAAGQFEIGADGVRHYVTQEDPAWGPEYCYDVCDGGGAGSGGGSGGSDGSDSEGPKFQGPYFTEAWFAGDVLNGHAEMSFILTDHASQEMTLTTSRSDGSTVGSQKFTSGRVWPFPIIFVETMTTDGSIMAPKCGARGLGTSVHDVSAFLHATNVKRQVNSQSVLMYQTLCQSAPAPGSVQDREDVDGRSPSGGLRICHRLDHYSSTGEFLYTETLYCYDVYAS